MVFDILFLEPDSAAEEFDEVFAGEMRAAGNVPAVPDAGPASSPTRPVSRQPRASLRLTSEESHDRARRSGASAEQNPTDLRRREMAHASVRPGRSRPGYINLTPDIDGTTRRLPSLAQVQNQAFLHIATSGRATS